MSVPVALGHKPPNEWPQTIVGDELGEFRRRAVPMREFILKVNSRCNLACDYCYIYEMQDISWAEQPGAMPVAVAQAAARRIADHARRHDLPSVSIVLHGGEPLLLGQRRLSEFLSIFESTLEPVTSVRFAMQTNGLLLTPEILEIADRFSMSISVSIDGDETANDRHRKRRNGTGTYSQVAQRIEMLRDSRQAHLFNGLLAVIDLHNDPLQTFDALESFDPIGVDFLLPHANWTSPQIQRTEDSATPFADWLIAIFDKRYSRPERQVTVRIFESILRLKDGNPGYFEALGLDSLQLMTIDTDGTYGLVDTLKSSYDGAASTSLSVHDNEIDEMLDLNSVLARQIGEDALADTCKQCDLKSVCGGGYYPHRYRAGAGFKNPSVYCADLYKLIRHISVSSQ